MFDSCPWGGGAGPCSPNCDYNIYFYTHFFHILSPTSLPLTRQHHYRRTTFFLGRRYVKNNFHPSSHRGCVVCVPHGRINKNLISTHTAYVFRMTNYWSGILRYVLNKKNEKKIGINICLQQHNSWRFKNELHTVNKNNRR